MLKTILDDLGLEKDAVWMLAEGSDNASNPRPVLSEPLVRFIKFEPSTTLLV